METAGPVSIRSSRDVVLPGYKVEYFHPDTRELTTGVVESFKQQHGYDFLVVQNQDNRTDLVMKMAVTDIDTNDLHKRTKPIQLKLF